MINTLNSNKRFGSPISSILTVDASSNSNNNSNSNNSIAPQNEDMIISKIITPTKNMDDIDNYNDTLSSKRKRDDNDGNDDNDKGKVDIDLDISKLPPLTSKFGSDDDDNNNNIFALKSNLTVAHDNNNNRNSNSNSKNEKNNGNGISFSLKKKF